MIATPLRRPGNALQRKIVRLGGARRENHFFRSSSNELRDLSAGVFDSQFSTAAGNMLRMRVSHRPHPEKRKHCVENPRIRGCRCLIVEVNQVRHLAMT
jgi:hypothetical protein